MVSASQDPRYALARQLAASRRQTAARPGVGAGPRPSKEQVQLGQAYSEAYMQFPSIRNRLEQIRAGEAAKPGGIQGLVADVLNSTPGKIIQKPLVALGVPGKAVVSTARELVDALDGNDKTKFSTSEWWNQTKDPTFGFGTAFDVNTGNKWADRAIGFLGDVALDPLTYVSFGSAGLVNGLSGRIAASGKYMAMARQGALGSTLSEAQHLSRAARIASEGVGFLDDAERRLLGLNDRGLYFGVGQRSKRIAGTERIAKVLEPAINRTRLRLMTGPRWIRKASAGFTPQSVRGARLALASGKFTDADTINLALEAVASVNVQKLSKAKTSMTLRRQARDIYMENGGRWAAKDNGETIDILQGVTGMNVPSPEAMNTATKARAWFEAVHQRVLQARQALAPASTVPYRENYVPWIWTNSAQRWIRDNPEEAKRLFGLTEHQFSWSPHFDARQIAEDDIWFGHKLRKSDLNIRRLNELARDTVGGDFFETNVAKIMSSYAESVADELATLDQIAYLGSKGIGGLGGMKAAKDSVQAAEEIAKAKVKVSRASVASSYEDARKAVMELLDSPITVGASIEGAYGAVAGEAVKFTDVLNAAIGDVNTLLNLPKVIEDASARADVIRQSLGEFSNAITQFTGSDGVPVLAHVAQSEAMNDSLARLASVKAEIDSLSAELADIAGRRTSDIAEYDRLSDIAATATKTLDDAKKAFNDSVLMAENINAAYHSAIAGEAWDSSTRINEFIGLIRGELIKVKGAPKGYKPPRAGANFAKRLGRPSSFGGRGYLSGLSTDLVSETSVRNITGSTISRTIDGAVAGKADLKDMARTAVWLMTFADSQFGEDQVRRLFATGETGPGDLFKELQDALKQADFSRKNVQASINKVKTVRGVKEDNMSQLAQRYDKVSKMIDNVRSEIETIDFRIAERERDLKVYQDLLANPEGPSGRQYSVPELKARIRDTKYMLKEDYNLRRNLYRGGQTPVRYDPETGKMISSTTDRAKNLPGLNGLNKELLEIREKMIVIENFQVAGGKEFVQPGDMYPGNATRRFETIPEGERALPTDQLVSVEGQKNVGRTQGVGQLQTSVAGLNASRTRLANAIESFSVMLDIQLRINDLQTHAAAYGIRWEPSVYDDVVRNVLQQRMNTLEKSTMELGLAVTGWRGFRDAIIEHMSKSGSIDARSFDNMLAYYRPRIQEGLLASDVGSALGVGEIDAFGQDLKRALAGASIAERRTNSLAKRAIGGEDWSTLVFLVDDYKMAKRKFTALQKQRRGLGAVAEGSRNQASPDMGDLEDFAQQVADRGSSQVEDGIFPSADELTAGTADDAIGMSIADAYDSITDTDALNSAIDNAAMELEYARQALKANASALAKKNPAFKDIQGRLKTVQDLVDMVTGKEAVAAARAEDVVALLADKATIAGKAIKKGGDTREAQKAIKGVVDRINMIIDAYEGERNMVRGIRGRYMRGVKNPNPASFFGVSQPLPNVDRQILGPFDSMIRNLFGWDVKSTYAGGILDKAEEARLVEMTGKEIPGRGVKTVSKSRGSMGEFNNKVRRIFPALEEWRGKRAESMRLENIIKAITAESDSKANHYLKIAGVSKKAGDPEYTRFLAARKAHIELQSLRTDVRYSNAMDALGMYNVLRGDLARYTPDNSRPFSSTLNLNVANPAEAKVAEQIAKLGSIDFTRREWSDLFIDRTELEMLIRNPAGQEHKIVEATQQIRRHAKAIEKLDRLRQALELRAQLSDEIHVKRIPGAKDAQETFAVVDAASADYIINIGGGTPNERLQNYIRSIFNADEDIAAFYGDSNRAMLMEEVGSKQRIAEGKLRRIADEEAALISKGVNPEKSAYIRELRRDYRLADLDVERTQARLDSLVADLELKNQKYNSRIKSLDSAWGGSQEKAILEDEQRLLNSAEYLYAFGANEFSLRGRANKINQDFLASMGETKARELVDAFIEVVGDVRQAEELLGGRDAIKRLFDVAEELKLSKAAADSPSSSVVTLDRFFKMVKRGEEVVAKIESTPQASDFEYLKGIANILGIDDPAKIGQESVEQVSKELTEFFDAMKQAMNKARNKKAFVLESSRETQRKLLAQEIAWEDAMRSARINGLSKADTEKAVAAAVKDAAKNPEKYVDRVVSTAGPRSEAARNAVRQQAQATEEFNSLSAALDEKYGVRKQLTGKRKTQKGSERYGEVMGPREKGAAATRRKELLATIKQLTTEMDKIRGEYLAGVQRQAADAATIAAQRAQKVDALSAAMYEFTFLSNISESMTDNVIADLTQRKAALEKALNLRGDVVRRLAPNASAEKRAQAINTLLEMYKVYMDTTKVLSLPDGDPIKAVAMHAQHKINKLLRVENVAQGSERALSRARAGTWQSELVRVYDDGMKEVQNLTGYQIPEELNSWFTQFKQLNPREMGEIGRMISGYTRFFRTYATLSVGFHVRNAMSNTFILMASGASLKNIKDGYIAYFNEFAKDIEAGLAKNAGGEFARAMEIALAAGVHGQYDEVIDRFGKTINDWRLTNWSARVGGHVEGSAKFTLALDTVRKNPEVTLDQAVARVNRYLFDYLDVGTADEAIRKYVPFWMFMSRNLPLTLTNQWMNPKAYAIYDHVVDNMTEEDESLIIPKYFKETGAFHIGNNMFIVPDLGFNRVPADIAMMQDPMRFAANLNPLFRVPAELAGGRSFFNNAPMGSTPVELTGVNALYGPLLSLAGQTETRNGRTFAKSQKPLYAIQNLVPTASVANRLAPTAAGTDSTMDWLRWLGAPIRELTPEQQKAELIKRRRLIQQEMAKERNMR